MQPGIHVVIPVHNRKGLTERCLETLTAQQYNPLFIVVVDDGSTDGTADMIRAKFPNVSVEQGDGTLWWSGAVNKGISAILQRGGPDDYVLLLNNDVEVGPEYVERLVMAALSRPRSLIGSVEVNIEKPELIIDGGVTIDWWTARYRFLNVGKRLTDFGQNYLQSGVSYLTGKGTLIPLAVFRDVGLFDDEHLEQCGDTELPVRASRRGYELLISYGAVVKSHTTASAAVNVSRRYSMRDFREYFFGRRSYTRLKYRFWFARRCTRSPLQFVCFLCCDLTRIVCHYCSRL